MYIEFDYFLLCRFELELVQMRKAHFTKSCFLEMVRCNATPSYTYRVNWLLRFESLSYINAAIRKLYFKRLVGCFCICKRIRRKIRPQDNKMQSNKSSYKSDTKHSHPIRLIQPDPELGLGYTTQSKHTKNKSRYRTGTI